MCYNVDRKVKRECLKNKKLDNQQLRSVQDKVQRLSREGVGASAPKRREPKGYDIVYTIAKVIAAERRFWINDPKRIVVTQSQIIYIMSRLRSEADMRPKMRMTCNPAGKGHWLTNWIEWYLLPTGLPDPEKCGVTRYFTMRDNEFVWGNSEQEVKDQVPGCSPLSFTFINANVYDNPVLMERQPEYVAWLEGQDRETKEALLYGNWYVTKTFDGYFKRAWVPVVQDPPFVGKRCRGFDLAGSVVDEVNKDPDYTATVLMSRNSEGNYCIEHAFRLRERYHQVEEYIFALHEADPPDITYVIPVDAGAAGKAYASGLQKQLAEKGRHCILHPTGNKSKLVRFRPFASLCQSGAVSIVSGEYVDWFFDELEQFQGDGKQHDDALDAAVSSHWGLNRQTIIPDFTLPDMSTGNPFALPFGGA